MKNASMKFITTAVSAAIIAAMAMGCGQTQETTAALNEPTPAETEIKETQAADTSAPEESAAQETADLSGSVSMAGSTSMEKLANAAAEAFMEKYPGVSVTAEFTGSGAGIESVLAGSVDIGNSSRSLKDEEKSAGAVENIVAIDGIAVVSDPANTVDDLTKDQLIAIYKGETKNWKELGGADQAIVVVGREAGSTIA